MTPLDPKYRQLLDRVRASDEPPAQLQDELWSRLAGRLDAPLPPTAAGAQRALAGKSSVLLASGPVIKLVIAGLVAGGVVEYVQQRERAAPVQSLATRPATPKRIEAIEVSRSVEPQPAAAATSSTLLAETELLAQAQRALQRGAPASALPYIDQHAATFPHGALSQERDAARVLALCALNRGVEARRAQRQFLQDWPASPLGDRVRRACASAPR